MSYLVYELYKKTDKDCIDWERMGFPEKDPPQKDLADKIKKSFTVDYMGAAEYEYGPFKKSIDDLLSGKYQWAKINFLNKNLYLVFNSSDKFSDIIERLYQVNTYRTKRNFNFMKKNWYRPMDQGWCFLKKDNSKIKNSFFIFNNKEMLLDLINNFNIHNEIKGLPLILPSDKNLSKDKKDLLKFLFFDKEKFKQSFLNFNKYSFYYSHWNIVDLAYYLDRELYAWILENSSDNIMKLKSKIYYNNTTIHSYFNIDIEEQYSDNYKVYHAIFSDKEKMTYELWSRLFYSQNSENNLKLLNSIGLDIIRHTENKIFKDEVATIFLLLKSQQYDFLKTKLLPEYQLSLDTVYEVIRRLYTNFHLYDGRNIQNSSELQDDILKNFLILLEDYSVDFNLLEEKICKAKNIKEYKQKILTKVTHYINRKNFLDSLK